MTGLTTFSTTSQPFDTITNDLTAGGLAHAAANPGLADFARYEFELFAETLRQDLAPESLLEHVLAERVVLASWRVHIITLDESESVKARPIVAVDGLDGQSAEASLESALTLLSLARKAQGPRWGRAEFPAASVADLSEEGDDQVRQFSFDLDDEFPGEWIASEDRFADADETDLFDEADEEGAETPVRWQDRLVFDDNVSETSPVVKGTWVTVGHVVSLIVDGWSWSDVLRAHPELTEDDVRTCLAYTVEQDNMGSY